MIEADFGVGAVDGSLAKPCNRSVHLMDMFEKRHLPHVKISCFLY
jgi:hypothetical protein